MLNRNIMNISILGVHTFALIEELLDLENQSLYAVFDGRKWCGVSDLKSAASLVESAFDHLYGGSSRATPTGFGFIADASGHVVAYSNISGRVYAVEYWKFNGVEQSETRIHISKLGLTKEAVETDMQEMLAVCG